ncbi:MAG: DNA translocase FtsK 4TM domain-containing protein, partial [Paramuribaculum sp.]|nr:DNA translocase FtsK 4TM domain-containing protein [Paramuribaculum sp.]
MDSFEISSESYDPTTLTSVRTQPAAPQHVETPHQASPLPNDMSRKPETSRPSTATPAYSSAERWKMFTGILFIVAAVYMLIVSISFFSNGAADQSLVQNTPYSDVSGAAKEIRNTGGPLGAVLSDILMSRWLGIGSFILIFYIGALGVSLVKIKHFNFWNLTYKCLLTAIVLSILTGFLTYPLTSYNYWGGNHGRVVNEMLMTHTGVWGAIAVNILLVSAVVLVFLKEIQYAWNMYSSRVKKHKERLAHERAEAEARRKKAEENLSGDISAINHPPVKTGYDKYPPQAVAAETPVEKPVYTAPPVAPVLEDIPDEIPEAPAVEKIPETPVASEVYDIPEKSEIPTESEISEVPVITELTEKPEQTEILEQIEKPEVTMTVNIPEEETEARHIQSEFYDPTAELSSFRSPSIDLLEDREVRTDHVDLAEQEENKKLLTDTLN